MQYNYLGKTGVQISSLCLGTMTFGDGADFQTSQEIYSICRDKGINFIDCANGYAKGESERILGKLIKPERDKVIVSSKVYYPTGDDRNARGLSRFHITKAIEASLNRLDTDYIDIYFLHHFDENTTLDETLRTLDDLVSQGKVLYIGLSNFSAWQIMKAIGICELQKLTNICCIQPMYNLLKRQCEVELLPMAKSENLAVFPYSPLAGGFLTGKYLKKIESAARFKTSTMYQKRYDQESNLHILKSFLSFAKENNYHPVSLAVAWAMSHPDVTAPIIGARNVEQLLPVLDSADIEMDHDLRKSITDLSLSPALATDRAEERI